MNVLVKSESKIQVCLIRFEYVLTKTPVDKFYLNWRKINLDLYSHMRVHL